MTRLAAIFIALLGFFAAPALAQTVPQTREQVQMTFAPLVKQTAPAVVNIFARKLVKQRTFSPFMNDPLFQEFFGGGMPGMTRERMENSLGSGVIVRADGLVVTNNHVISGADEIHVVLSDRREFEATLVTTDEKTDLAVLRLKTNGEQMPFLELRDSDSVEVGDMVLAIGNPFGVGQTVTGGIISAVARTGPAVDDMGYYIQTDAAINPGNSGGALVSTDGRMVGINSAIYSRTGGNIGIGFAIPANMVRVVIDAVVSGKKNVVRPWLGVTGQEVTSDIARSLGLVKPSGVLVNEINAISPAGKAGLKVGDVIMAVNGREVEGPEALDFRIGTMQVGGLAIFRIKRADSTKDINFTLIAPPETQPRDTTRLAGTGPLAGAVVVNISPAVVAEYGLRDMDESEKGVVVVDVKEGSPAAGFGLRDGDILLYVNKTVIGSVDDVVEATRSAAEGWRIRLRRGRQIMNVFVR
ncbi:MAG: Do family serine endopeptidase [Alphaproteobacteria bacterium]|nr:Do family serine endopeptidase [Alphaproteobacteria bacterium]